MGRKLLVMDLDGTAVRDDYQLAPGSREALERFRRAGNYSAFATGRRDVDMKSMGEDRWVTDYLILNNGGKIERCADRSTISLERMDPESCRKLILHCLETGQQLNIYSDGRWQTNVITPGTVEYGKLLGEQPELITSLDEVAWQEGIEHFYAANEDMWPVQRFIQEELPLLQPLQSEPDCMDVLPMGVSKWEGIWKLAQMLGIAHEDVYAAGNFYNDIDMVERAGVGLAVANAIDEVREAADFVTENDNNGEAVAEMVDGILSGRYRIG